MLDNFWVFHWRVLERLSVAADNPSYRRCGSCASARASCFDLLKVWLALLRTRNSRIGGCFSKETHAPPLAWIC